MSILDDRVDAFCRSPAGCTFLLVVAENDLAPEVAADPLVAINVAAVALSEINIWRSDHEQVVSLALEAGAQLQHLARAILGQPQATWMFAPVDRTAQWAIVGPGATLTPEGLVTPTSPPSDWERYAQKPALADYSSTVVDDTCSILAAMEHGAGDFYPEPPIGRFRLHVAPWARVFDVDGPSAWHHLAMRYPALDDEGRSVPDWGRFAEEWDAVHLTLGGLLTAEQVRVEGAHGWSELQAWDAEQTAWVRWCFDSVARLPDLEAPPSSPIVLNRPRVLFFLD